MICNLLPLDLEKASESEITVYFCDAAHSDSGIKATTLCINAQTERTENMNNNNLQYSRV
ncbi:hypothetical protein GBAG_2385 [Buttiauxella agrestis ATCC 33320]|uniref:Uncharacterized protein n=1 Tax=Buttiauxella agrestis ATCC 33320 TaxID=1006004 RepID=A0A085GD05_9ENTR|nr:hypothetical protein GBAG_2385 [Buttiauxella agrestis ATCC 33320]